MATLPSFAGKKMRLNEPLEMAEKMKEGRKYQPKLVVSCQLDRKEALSGQSFVSDLIDSAKV